MAPTPHSRLARAALASALALALTACGGGGGAPQMPPTEVNVAGVVAKSVAQWDEFTGRIEAIAEDERERYGPSATQRMSVRCIADTGEGWADLIFGATSASHTAEVIPGARVRTRILRADGGFFDYPIVSFVALESPGDPTRAAPEGAPSTPASMASGFDLRRAQTDPAVIGSVQSCVVAHAGDIEMLNADDLRSRAYPVGAQNRMTIRCRHTGGEEWADLVFMPAQALDALHVSRGDNVRVTVVSRTGGFFDYPVLQLVR